MYGYFVISDLPTLDIFVQMLFWKKIGSEIPYLAMVWTYVQTFVVFFGPFPNWVLHVQRNRYNKTKERDPNKKATKIWTYVQTAGR